MSFRTEGNEREKSKNETPRCPDSYRDAVGMTKRSQPSFRTEGHEREKSTKKRALHFLE
ncbi:hypothetical protein PP182_04465 [Maribacter sp. PR1]|uniref:Uncharacterized protein n=1 Tax=Maribacter cobaltidurans TaxID=1178778 RepID=A0ABU7IQS2_9FLAO|nr:MULTISPECIES: hypothetical protein [Maribacter]MDC6387919.1 hypothetical protein [Maribacter sp. PR1]MEE1975308.1 hypothetical protein [Maribacter cobaltidurans]